MYSKYCEFLRVADMQCRVCSVTGDDMVVNPVYPESFYCTLPGRTRPGVSFDTFRSYILKRKHLDRKRKKVVTRMSESLSRTKSRIFELALCNSFSYFCTFTFAKGNGFNRKNLKECYKAFSDYIRVLNRKDKYNIRYLIIPEKHKDGSWHFHGLLSGLPSCALHFFSCDDWDLSKGRKLPYRLIRAVRAGEKVCSWTGASSRFGWNTLMPVKSAVAVSKYITKYITKSLCSDLACESGSHLYYCSKGLSRSRLCKKGFLVPQNFLKFQDDCFFSEYCCSYSCDYSDSSLSELMKCISDEKEVGCSGYGYDSDSGWLDSLRVCKSRDICCADTAYRSSEDYRIWEYIKKKFPDIDNLETMDCLVQFYTFSDNGIQVRSELYNEYILYIDRLYPPIQLRL